jgi:hypothetical protein
VDRQKVKVETQIVKTSGHGLEDLERGGVGWGGGIKSGGWKEFKSVKLCLC